MVDWMIRKLGGIPKWEAIQNRSECFKLINQSQNDIANLQNLLKDRETRIQELAEMLVVKEKVEEETSEPQHPLPRSRPSWPRMRKYLEERDVRQLLDSRNIGTVTLPSGQVVNPHASTIHSKHSGVADASKIG